MFVNQRTRARRKMDYLDNTGVSSRCFKIVYYGNLLFWVALAMLLIIFIIRELFADNSELARVMELQGNNEPFEIPDMKNILMWGFNGEGVNINISKLYPGHQEEYKSGLAKYRLNKYLSDRISMRRTLPDVRSHECRQKSADLMGLPTASVVVVFRNEPRTTLLRMLYSVVDKSPDKQLQDIILVDDSSNVEDLRFPKLEHYVSGLAKVRIIRLSTYHGVARARMYGAEAATGEVLIFLQPRCECTDGWMTPLLEGIAAARNTIAVPVVDQINYNTFQYSHDTLSEMKLGSFTWSLATKKKLMMKPVESALWNVANPVIADGIFAVARSNLLQLGGFDEGLLTEDSVNIEFSFRSWMCGYKIVLVPCSHVGYLALMTQVDGSDMLNKDSILDNLRIANTLMDNYKYFVYERMKVAAHRNNLQLDSLIVPGKVPLLQVSDSCKRFYWYLQMVEPDMLFSSEIDRSGQVFLIGVKNRIYTLGVWDGKIVVQDHKSAPVTFWYLLKSGTLVTENKTCLSYEPDNVKTEQVPIQQMSFSMDLEYKNTDSDQSQHDQIRRPQLRKTFTSIQNPDQLDSSVDSKALSENHHMKDNLLFNSDRRQLNYIQELNFKEGQQPQFDLQFKEDLNEVTSVSSQEVNTKFYETQIRSRSLLNSIVHKLDVTRPIVKPPISNENLDQTGNTHGLNDWSVSNVVMKPCDNEIKGDQWIYIETQTLQHVKSGLCLEAQKSIFGKYLLNLVQCDRSRWAQQWKLGLAF